MTADITTACSEFVALQLGLTHLIVFNAVVDLHPAPSAITDVVDRCGLGKDAIRKAAGHLDALKLITVKKGSPGGGGARNPDVYAIAPRGLKLQAKIQKV